MLWATRMSEHHDEAHGDVVRLSSQQRNAVDGEPTCVICGRYGEYVCDATDEDVCSLECRDVCTQRRAAGEGETGGASHKRKAAPGDDEAASLPWKLARDEHTSEEEEEEEEEASNLARKQLCIQAEVHGAPGEKLPCLCTSFDSFPLQLIANLAAKGFESPTPVQMQTIPAILEGASVLVSAPTGTGKTAAFLLPVVTQILNRRDDGEDVGRPHAIVLAPVRELAMQIEDEAKALMKGILGMKTALLIGGLPVASQLHRLRQGVQVVVATPGRLLGILTDHCDDTSVGTLLDDVRCCVVDEVDMMLSIGFLDMVMQIIGFVIGSEGKAQLVFSSATISSKVESVVAKCTASYLRVRVGVAGAAGQETASSALVVHSHVAHSVVWMEENAKKAELFRFIEEHPGEPTLVFVDSRVGADLLADAIRKKVTRGHAVSFHAGKSQQERLQILEDFIEERVQVIVTTNVLGRGIDMLSVTNVVIFDAPKTIEDYVHLVGRAGRDPSIEDVASRKEATSQLYVNAKDTEIFDGLVRLFRQTDIRLPRDVYSALHARYRQKRPQSQAHVAIDDARRAFHVVHSNTNETVSQVARRWRSWKSNTAHKQSRPR